MKKINIIIWSGIKADKLILFSFLFSGCAALIYQVSWQRALYGLIGVDMDSITIIVSVFMLGIGLGGMLGGWLSDQVRGKPRGLARG
jgi:predicted MFS family arabinose efflux permease